MDRDCGIGASQCAATKFLQSSGRSPSALYRKGDLFPFAVARSLPSVPGAFRQRVLSPGAPPRCRRRALRRKPCNVTWDTPRRGGRSSFHLEPCGPRRDTARRATQLQGLSILVARVSVRVDWGWDRCRPLGCGHAHGMPRGLEDEWNPLARRGPGRGGIRRRSAHPFRVTSSCRVMVCSRALVSCDLRVVVTSPKGHPARP